MSETVEYGRSAPEPALTTIGDIVVSQHWVTTPAGVYPIRGTVWTVADMSHTTEQMSTVGIVLAVVFIWLCFLSLLFLLLKERRVAGYIQVTVQGDGFHHSTLIPATYQPIFGVQQMVNYARTVAAAA